MAKYQRKEVTFDEAVSALGANGFEISAVSGIAGHLVKKYGCAAGIDKDPILNHTHITAKPGYLIGGEIARLVDKGYQKFLKTSKIEVPASADHLSAMHRFNEELKEITGLTSLYNEALGTVSDRYVYDRVKDRDDVRPPLRPWEK